MHGLSRSEVADRIAGGETNSTKRITSRPLLHIIRDNVFTLFNAILTVCFAAIIFFGEVQDGFFYGIVVANSLIGIVQEVRAKLALDRLALLDSPVVAVRRDDETVLLGPTELVLGDTVLLRAGDQVVADAVLIAGVDLSLDESLLTGESEPVEPAPGARILSGSLVSTGTGYATVTAVGDASYANRLTAEIRRHSLARSELRGATNRILVFISWGLGPIIAAVVGSRLLTYGDEFDVAALGAGRWPEAVTDVVASVVGMIPEGLVLLISLAFGVAAIRLARRRVLVQELAAVEILARVDVICLDKTGTLTTGEISFVGAEKITSDPAMAETLGLFARGDDANATARALASFYPDVGGTALNRAPFSSARAFSAIESSRGENTATWLLGAPEVLFARHPESKASASQHAANGLRVLALARSNGRLGPIDQLDPRTRALTPVAILLFSETMRPDAAATVMWLKEQGVRPIIISGDSPATVMAMVAGFGMGSVSADARDLNSDAALRAALASGSVLGRVSPDQKRAIVRVLQEDGHTVAMTGDGVNDAMAIKDADLGIAMGSGTPASRAVARIVLLDNEFGRLPALLAYGRQVIANVERVANLFLAKTVYGIIFAVVFALLLWEFPFLPRQLTLVSTVTIGIPSFFLALAPNARRYRPGILGRLLRYAAPTGAFAAAVTIGAHAVVRQLVDPAEARSITTVTLFIVGFWILCVLARPLDRWRAILLLGMAALFVSAIALPAAAEFFAMTIRPDVALLVGIVAGLAGAAGIEAVYRLARRTGLLSDRQ